MSQERLFNEASLVREMQAGSEEAFTTLYRYYSPRLYLNILSIVRDPSTAEEMVQELFTRVWQNKESTGLEENPGGYMYRIGINLVHDFFRKMQRDRQLLEKFKQLASENYEHIEESIHAQETTAIFQKALDQLSPQQKKVYELVKFEGHTYKKTAEILGISSFTVKEYLVAANKQLRSYLLQHLKDPLALLLFSAVLCDLSGL